jgi:hypothetical protein
MSGEQACRILSLHRFSRLKRENVCFHLQRRNIEHLVEENYKTFSLKTMLFKPILATQGHRREKI